MTLFALWTALAAPVADAPLTWSSDGTHLQVGQVVWKVGSDDVRALPADWKHSELSPSGRSSAGMVDGVLQIRGALSLEVPLGNAYVAWLDAAHLLVFERVSVHEASCAVLTLGQAEPVPITCPTSDYHLLYDVVPGPANQLAVRSAGEGHPGVNFVTWTNGTSAPLVTPALDLYPSGPVEVSFAADRVWLHTPCDFREERGCNGTAKRPWYVFSFAIGDSEVTRHEAALPAGLAFDAAHQRFAWLEPDGRVCIGPAGRSTCRRLPTARANAD